MVIEYEHVLPTILTDAGPRSYIADIYVEYVSDKEKTIYIGILEISGGIHFKNKKQYSKNKLRRESLVNYFNNDYNDNKNPEYKIIFSYIIFQPDDFLYNKFDFFREIFEDKFMNGGHYFEY